MPSGVTSLVETLLRPPAGGEATQGYLSASFLLTMRTELFQSDRQERASLCSPVLDRLYLQLLEPEEYTRALRQLFPSKAQGELKDFGALIDYGEAPGNSVLGRPLFLRFLSELAPDHVRSLQRAISEDSNPTVSGFLFLLYGEVFRMWFRRETEKERADFVGLTADLRAAFCKQIAIRFADPIRAEQVVDFRELMHIASEAASAAGGLNDETRLAAERFDREAQLSMLLVRVPGTDKFRFAHAAIFEFFLANAINDAVVSKRYSLLGRISFSSSWAMFFRFLSAMERDATDRTSLLSLCEASTAAVDSELSAAIIRSHRVSRNLLVAARALAELDGDDVVSVGRITLSGASVSEGKVAVEGHGVIAEFAELSGMLSHASASKVLAEPARSKEWWELGEVRQDVRRISRFADDATLMWTPVAGGIYSVRAQVAGEDLVGSQRPSVLTQRTERIFVPSFLVQSHPTTNLEFLKFLQSPQGHRWRPEGYREETTNDKYLAEWNQWIQQLGPPESWPLFAERSLGKSRGSYEKWLRSPVVFVNWAAANACAKHFHARLPTEAEYSVISLFFQGETRRSWDYMWDKNAFEGYAMTIASGNHGSAPTTSIDCTELHEALPSFRQWAEKVHRSLGVRPPLHTIGLVAEWTDDVWDANWPLSEERALGPGSDQVTWLYPRNTGLTLDENHKIVRRRAITHRRAIRSGSVQSHQGDCLLSCRKGAPEHFCNPDYGFRLARPLMFGEFESKENQS